MDSTDTIMERLADIAAGFDQLDQSDEASLLRDILDLRSQYSAEVARLFGAMAGDQRLRDHPEIAAEFGKKFLETRHAVTDLQLRWRMQRIEADPKGYLAEVKQVVGRSDAVLNWGMAALKAVA